MPVAPGGYTYTQQVYIHKETANKSFVDMHLYLKDRGIQNNSFFLILYDRDLAGVDPRDPRLNQFMKAKILAECRRNYWYFLREIVRIPDQGGQVGSGVRYKMHRGNLAMNFGFERNWNMFIEFPRQNFKSISAVCRYLWVFNFGTTNSEMMFINKKHEDSKMNLQRLKELREAMPTYLRMETAYGADGKKLKPKNSAETLEHVLNHNKIKTMASARNKTAANSLGRGCTQPIQWYDEYAFIPYNGIVYLSATPAFNTASQNARKNNSPYGILITTTPGDLTTDEGLEAFYTKEDATNFDELMYDMNPAKLNEVLTANKNSSFIYMRFTYQQLGRDEAWFAKICVLMKKNWSDIRREVLLEWAKASDNCPFSKEDLNKVRGLLKDPIQQIYIGKYKMNIYCPSDLRNPPIIGVDVSGGFKRDSSAITIIDSLTTKVIADFNCNYISPDDLAGVIYELVTKYMPNAIVNVERNGGFGASVISKLMKTRIKRNLYFEIKDKVIEERFDNGRATKQKQRTKVYGLDSTKAVRDNLMEILRERMLYHKDKFVSPVIYSELETLETKRNGKIEHTSTGHDDQVFSYLMALYVWYEGTNLMEQYGITKKSLKTDEDVEGVIIPIEEQYSDICKDLQYGDDETVKRQLDYLKGNAVTYEEYMDKLQKEDDEKFKAHLQHPLARKAYVEHYNMDPNEVPEFGTGQTKIPDDIFNNFNS